MDRSESSQTSSDLSKLFRAFRLPLAKNRVVHRHDPCFVVCMLELRIQQLADGEELVWFKDDDWARRTLVDDPRQELLEHRHAVEAPLECGTTVELSTPEELTIGGASPARHALNRGDQAHLIILARVALPLGSDQGDVENHCFTQSS
jgi:hypothetical protein